MDSTNSESEASGGFRRSPLLSSQDSGFRFLAVTLISSGAPQRNVFALPAAKLNGFLGTR